MNFQTFEYMLSTLTEEDSMIKIIRLLNISKAHGLDEISICMLKMYDLAISKPLLMIFESCISQGEFPDAWKKANMVKVHEKIANSL